MAIPLGQVLLHLRKLLDRSATAELADAALLERFLTRQDETAFEELLVRHGPMVLAVCRQLLQDPHDAEDAFQATFLILVLRAAAIGKRERLAGWLYGVTQRVARRARQQARRRRDRERQGLDILASAPDPSSSEELAPVVHEEIQRLPEKYRNSVILCYLQGKTQEEAARDLGWTPGMVKGRLERARALLRKRLQYRGLALSVGALATLVCPSASTVAPALVAVTRNAALAVRMDQSLAAGAISTSVLALMEGVLRIMFLTKLKLTVLTLLMVGVVSLGVAVSAYRLLAAEPATDSPNADAHAILPAPPQREEAAKTSKPDEKPRHKVQVMHPFSGRVPDCYDCIGRIEVPTAEVYASVSGQVVQVHFQAGTSVKKGQPLVDLDPREAQVELDKAQAELSRAKARMKYLAAQLDRAKKAHAAGTLPQGESERISAEHEEAGASAQVALANCDLAKLHRVATTIMAPVSGQVGRLLIVPGSVVKAGTTMLTTIVVDGPIYLNFELDERTFLDLQRRVAEGKFKLLGATVLFRLANEMSPRHRATIDFVGNQLRPQTGAIPVRAVVAKPQGSFVPGLSVGIQVPVTEPYHHSGFLVPIDAVYRPGSSRGDQSPCVLVVTGQNVVECRYVSLGKQYAGWWFITKGLEAEDWIIIESGEHNLISGGAVVEPEQISGVSPPIP